MLVKKLLMALSMAAVLGFMATGANASSVYLTITQEPFDEPVPASVHATVTDHINIGEYDQGNENQTDPENMHQKYTITFGGAADGAIASVVISEGGFTVTQGLNVWILQKNGRNQRPLVIEVEGSFVTPGRDKEVKIEGEVTLSGGARATANASSMGDCFDLSLEAAHSCVNAGWGGNLATAGDYLILAEFPPYSPGPTETDVVATPPNADVVVDGPYYLGVGCPGSGGAGWVFWVKPGYPGRYNYAGNANAVGTGNIIVDETGGGGYITKLCQLTVTNAPPVILSNNLPNVMLTGSHAYCIEAGDPEGAVTISVAGDLQTLRNLLRAALGAAGVSEIIAQMQSGNLKTILTAIEAVASDPVLLLAIIDYYMLDTMPNITGGTISPSSSNAGAFVYSFNLDLPGTPLGLFYDTVQLVRTVCNQQYCYTLTVTVNSNDGGPSLVQNYGISIE